MPDRRQSDRRQGERRETQEDPKSVSLSVFIITIASIVVFFIIFMTCVILNFQKNISNLNNQSTDLTLLPSADETDNLSVLTITE